MNSTVNNLVTLFHRQAARLGPAIALRFKQDGLYHDLSWSEYYEHALACASALLDVGVKPGDRVGLLAENSWTWLCCDLGILTAAAVHVPIHTPLSASQVCYQLLDADVVWLFVSNRKQLDKALEIRNQLPALRGIVVFDALLAQGGIISWAGFLQRGRRVLPSLASELARRESSLHTDSLATLMYTSGTTGRPKGVMLTHGNLLSNAQGVVQAAQLAPTDVWLSWLPYSHIFARTVDHYAHLAAGTVLALAESAETVLDNLTEVQPTMMTAVPRFYEKVLSYANASTPAQTSARLKEIFGTKIKWLSSGGAPLPNPVAEAYHAAGLLLLQGYGLTECAPVITFNRHDCFKLNTVGPALPGVEIAISPDGEVLTRGPHVMQGYWKNPTVTHEVLQNGWLYTGDLGAFDADGFLRITGRKKEILVLSNGKKVPPTYLEGLLVADLCIDQVVVCGEGRSFLTALIVPHWENVCRALGRSAAEPTVLRDDLEVQSLLQQRIDVALAEVAEYERVKEIVLLIEPFSIANEQLTVSMKLRRNVIVEQYRTALEALYK